MNLLSHIQIFIYFLCLKHIKKIKRKKLYGILGKVGSGKTSLLMAILGEVPNFKGKLILNSL